MRNEIIISLVLHVIVIGVTLTASPFDVRPKQMQYDDIIRVNLADMLPSSEPVAIEPMDVAVPEATYDEDPDIPITDPSTIDEEAVVPEKPKPEPEKPKPKPPPQEAKPSDQNQSGTESGETEIETPGGANSPFGGATVDNASFDYPYWFRQTFNKIASNWRNTIMYDGTLICVVYFQVLRTGTMIEVRVEQSSGIGAFDETCVNAVRAAAPFPPFPREFRDDIIGITIPFKASPR